MSKLHMVDYQSPIGIVEIVGTEDAIVSILFTKKEKQEHVMQGDTPNVLELCCLQLDEYFKGKRSTFSFPYLAQGTDFQQTVWNALKQIPYAETGSYKDIAVAIGNEKAIRAVGSANGKNKLSIVIPCHRIIGSDGKLTGYAGGLWRKEWLLEHERAFKKE
ncbi:methylated-DNA--[protein]-cysteine S-methyltransferase [Paucisalibacillus sp. EB02]|uniref:methylated-DNA--[protein]-cysteine S-methyltransferase n=1 Tax=Paucisalibacillus sp. EB02 TaxID=1347087 RepID=UPI0004B22AFC|nr:methylated-DNA--[protein]-cysteine S-methyltransferase [Paucisalibacillus sp. EB02]